MRTRLTKRESLTPELGEAERYLSALGGAASVLIGLRARSLAGGLLGILGGYLVYRGVTGHCPLSQRLLLTEEGFEVTRAVTIDRPAEELYAFWRDFTNLPRVMRHLESVKVDGDRSRWTTKAPFGSVSWDAVMTMDRENELIAWRSLEGADVPNAGSVRFQALPDGRGTEVIVSLRYHPPAGRLGLGIAKIFGEAPERQLSDDLRRFKGLMETGEVATTTGQPSGRARS
jgi:uncharacterized membrane protein